MDTLEILIQARELIAREVNWTQQASARTSRGISVLFDDPDAYSFCAVGAIRRTIGTMIGNEIAYVRATEAIARPLCDASGAAGPVLVEWNDGSSHTEVLAGFDAVIARLKKRGKDK